MNAERMQTGEAARGRWREILPALGVAKKFLTGKNGPCPICGGRDRFRYTDRSKDGDYFCNQCGAGKGIKLVMKVNGWTFKAAARAVDDLIGNRLVHRAPLDKAHRLAAAFFDECPDPPDQYAPPKSLRDATLWLRKYHLLKLPEFLARHDPLLTIWLDRERPFGHWLGDKWFTCEGSLINVRKQHGHASAQT